jgi:hypothetical protein
MYLSLELVLGLALADVDPLFYVCFNSLQEIKRVAERSFPGAHRQRHFQKYAMICTDPAIILHVSI